MAHEAGELLDVLEHPNQVRCLSQRILVERINGYVHLVLYVEADDRLFLKTIIPMVKEMPDTTFVAQLDAKEQQLLDDFEHDAMLSVATPSLLEGLRESARATDRRISASTFAYPATATTSGKPVSDSIFQG